MGNGPLNNSIGYGGATVFNPNQAIQQFGNILAQQKADKAAKDKALVDQMASLKSDGIRAADKDDYLNKYNDWKQSLISANNMPRNSRDRLDAIATAQSKYNDLGEFIGNSKDQKAHENSLGNMLLSNGHMFSDDAHQQVTKSMASPMSSSDFINSDKYGTLERYVDPVKQDDAFDKAGKTMLKASEWGNPIQSQGVDKQGNKTGVVVHSERQVEPEDILANAAHMYTLSPDTKHYIDKKYNSITGDTPQTTMMARLRQNAIDRGDLSVGDNGQLVSGLTEKTKPEFKADRAPDRFYQHFTFAQQNGTASQMTPAQTLLTTMQQQTPGTGEKLASLAPKGQYAAKDHVGLGINPTTGTHDFSFPAHVDQKAIEFNKDMKSKWAKEYPDLPYDPTVTGYGKLKEETVAPAKNYQLNPNSPDYVAQAAQMAKEQNINLSQLNQIEGVKGGHGQIPQVRINTQPTQQPSVKKMIKQSDISSKAAAAGYTVKEYTQLLRQKGVIIQ